MTHVDRLAAKLKEVEASLHRKGKTHISFSQEPQTSRHMSFNSGNGRLCIKPSSGCYVVSLSGALLVNEMTPIMNDLFGHKHNGEKQGQPYWRTGESDFELVRSVIEHYANLASSSLEDELK